MATDAFLTPDSRWNRLPFLILIIIIISSTRKADPYGTPRSGPAEYGDFLDSLLFRLRDMEVLNESGPLKGTQQFTGSHVLIASMGGGERLMLSSREIRLERNTACFCPPAKPLKWTPGGKA
jgi:hypothetical protein